MTTQRFAHYAAARARKRDERRRYGRAPLYVNVQLSQGRRLVRRPTRDISESGICISTDEFDEASRVKLFVPIPLRFRPGARMCLMEATVVWRRDGVSGLRFVNPPPTSLRQVRDFVATRDS